MKIGKRAAKVIRFVAVWAAYITLVAAFLIFLNSTGFWNSQDNGTNTTGPKQKSANIKQEKRIPNLWERPTTVTFKITKDTIIEINNGGTQRYDRYGNLWHEEDPPLRETASVSNLFPDEVVVVLIDEYYSNIATKVSIQRLVGFHEGEEPRPEYVLGGPGWANNITFSGWIVSSSSTEITVRYP